MTTLTVLGSGAAVPTSRRGPPGLLLTIGSGESFLIDPGPGALHRAVMAGTTVEEIHAVFLTHHHPDHTLDLMSLLFARHSVLLRPKLGGLLLVGPRDTRDLYDRMTGLYGRWVSAAAGDLVILEIDQQREGQRLELTQNHALAAVRLETCGEIERDLRKIQFERKSGAPDFVCSVARTAHTENSIGYRFEFPEGTIALSGDSGTCAELIDLGRNADILLLESSVPDEYRGTPGHLCPSEAGELAARAEAKKLVVYHLYPPVERDAALESIKRVFTGEAVVAEDGDAFDL